MFEVAYKPLTKTDVASQTILSEFKSFPCCPYATAKSFKIHNSPTLPNINGKPAVFALAIAPTLCGALACRALNLIANIFDEPNGHRRYLQCLFTHCCSFINTRLFYVRY